MVKFIMGQKGTGKTKKLVELVKQAVVDEHGDVVCIEKDKNLTYDIPYTVRLIHAKDYDINSNELLKGFISGLHAGNYDITHVFIDNFYKILSDTSDESVSELLAWMDRFSERENVKFTVSATCDPEAVGESIRKYAE